VEKVMDEDGKSAEEKKVKAPIPGDFRDPSNLSEFLKELIHSPELHSRLLGIVDTIKKENSNSQAVICDSLDPLAFLKETGSFLQEDVVVQRLGGVHPNMGILTGQYCHFLSG
jgi:hypothetical protein